jgi:signal peptide peptidase SppA
VNHPLALLPDTAHALFQARPATLSEIPTYGSESCGYDVVMGIAIIWVRGVLVQTSGCLRPCWGWWGTCTGYDGIRQNIATALLDDTVRGIVLAIDSPGGEVAGCFDLVDMIYSARDMKPIHAVLCENAYSAAYAIASAASSISVPRTGGTGSIGVVLLHMDMSGMLEKAGITPTFIQFGARKTDANAVQPLSNAARERMQVDVDMMGELFVDTVARNRGIAASVVRDTEAATYLGAAGVAQRLADSVAAPDEAFRAIAA